MSHMSNSSILSLKNASVHYGGVNALTTITVHIPEGEIVAIMGPNGAGKSTVLKSIFGLTELSGGHVEWQGHAINPTPHEMVLRGVSFVPQGRRTFANLTVEENLEIGGYIMNSKKLIKERITELFDQFPLLKQRRKSLTRTLSGGQQQLVAIGRGLMPRPKVLLLDEPSLGLSPKMVKEVFETIKTINDLHKTTIVVVEHNLTSLLHIVNRGYILDRGEVVACQNREELHNSDLLEQVFMGKHTV